MKEYENFLLTIPSDGATIRTSQEEIVPVSHFQKGNNGHEVLRRQLHDDVQDVHDVCHVHALS